MATPELRDLDSRTRKTPKEVSAFESEERGRGESVG
jgi:hypothetical protein